MSKQIGRLALMAVAVMILAGCTAQLVASYNSQLAQQASSMQAEVSSWDLTMRQGAGTITDDPRNPDVAAMLNKWRGEADAMLTLAVSSDPHSVNCDKAAQAVYTGMESLIPASMRASAQPVSASNSVSSSSCEARLVADLNSGIDDVESALKWCTVSWVPGDYFASLSQKTATAPPPPAAPSKDDQDRLTKSCLAEFKAPQQASENSTGTQHGRAVSHLLTTLQAIVYVENRKQAATSQ